VRYAHKKVKHLQRKTLKGLRAARLCETVRPSKVTPPKVAVIREQWVQPLPRDRAPFPREHGHPLDVERHRKLRMRTKGETRPTVRVEPRLLNGDYNNPRNELWRKVESKTTGRGVPFKGPLTFKAVRAMFNMSVLLNSVYWFCESAHTVKRFHSAKRMVHVTRLLLSREAGALSSGSLGESILRQCSIRLRSTESELNSAGFGLDPTSTVWGG